MQRAFNDMTPIQRNGVGKARSSGAVAFGVWMGIGKTFMGLTSGLLKKPQTWLIIAPKNSLHGWHNEIIRWFPEFSSPELYCVVSGQAVVRQHLYKRKGPLFFVTTAQAFLRDIEWLIKERIRFDVITVDEAKRAGLSNHKSATFKAVKAITDRKYYPNKLINFLAGRLSSKGNPQLFGYLHILNRQLFSSYWGFIKTYNELYAGPFGATIGPPKNMEGFALVTSPYLYIVGKEEAEKELPPIRRTKLITSFDDKQFKAYNQLANDLYLELGDGSIDSVATILAAYTKLRKLICCPAIIDPSLGIGPAIEVVLDKIKDQEDDLPNWRHNIIATPFLDSIPHFKACIAHELDIPLDKVLVFKGGLSIEELNALEIRFRKEPDTIALMSLLYAQAYNLESALNCYFPHFDWDPEANMQAEARGRRQTSDKGRTIMSYYVDIKGTITDDMFSMLTTKEVKEKLTYAEIYKLRERLHNQTV